ncbi:MAG: transglutaminase-like domain-containing protein [Candidatus Micrarchaeia archaeon]|jgi:hypothetical protein
MKTTTKVALLIGLAGITACTSPKGGKEQAFSAQAELFQQKQPPKLHSGQVKDEGYQKFRQALLAHPMTFSQAASLISKATGVDVQTTRFKAADSLKITSAKRFYALYALPFFFPDNFRAAFGTQTLSMASNHVFDTYAKNPKDGRIAALAAYIACKQKCKTPGDAAQAVISWVANNIVCDMASLSIPSMEIGGSDTAVKEAEKFGYGKTNNFQNSIAILGASGICIDYTNISADLLNSIGIPSRSVVVASHGIRPEDVEAATSLGHLIKSITHSILEINLPSGSRYFNVTPMYTPETGELSASVLSISDPFEYIKGRLERRYGGIKVFRVVCFRSLPSERFAQFPAVREMLDGDIARANEAGIAIIADPKLSGMLYGIGSDYNLQSWDRMIDMMQSNPEKFTGLKQ